MKLSSLVLASALPLTACQNPGNDFRWLASSDTADTATFDSNSDDTNPGTCQISLQPQSNNESVNWELSEGGDNALNVSYTLTWYNGAVKRIVDEGQEASGEINFLPHIIDGHSIQENELANGRSLETKISIEATSNDGTVICQEELVVPFANLELPGGLTVPTEINWIENALNTIGSSFNESLGVRIVKSNDLNNPDGHVIITDLFTGDVYKSYQITDAESDVAYAGFINGVLVVITNAYPSIKEGEIITYNTNGEMLTRFQENSADEIYMHHRAFIQSSESGEVKIHTLNWINTGGEDYPVDSSSITRILNMATGTPSTPETIFSGENILLADVSQYCNSTSLSPAGADGKQFRLDTCPIDNGKDTEYKYNNPYFVAIDTANDTVSYIFVREEYENDFDLTQYPNAKLISLPDLDGQPPLDFVHDATLWAIHAGEENTTYRLYVYNLLVEGNTRLDTYEVTIPNTNGDVTADFISTYNAFKDGEIQDGMSNGNIIDTGNPYLVGMFLGNTNGSIYWLDPNSGETIGSMIVTRVTTYQTPWVELTTLEDLGINGSQEHQF